MPNAPHVGGYLDLTGRAESPGWRIAQYADYLGFAQGTNNELNNFPLYIQNGGRVTMGTHQPAANAVLTVDGNITGTGINCRNGTGGAAIPSAFNIYWNEGNAGLWINTTRLGSITYTSDYRLKKNVSPITTPALERVKQLKPVNFEYKDIEGDIFKADGIAHEGFIAHELKEVIPSAVDGEKDELNNEGKIQPQTVKAVPIIAILTMAIQELEAKIEILESENGQLKNQVAQLDALSSKIAEIEASLSGIQTQVPVTSMTEK